MKLAFFVSGRGSLIDPLMEYILANHSEKNTIEKNTIEKNTIEVSAVIADRDCPAKEKAKKYNLPFYQFKRSDTYKYDKIEAIIQDVDAMFLIGYLGILPPEFCNKYPKRIINIHPSLLPKYGGKGWYGEYVLKAVLDSGDPTSGITIHYVNEIVDGGDVLLTKEFDMKDITTLELLKNRISYEEKLLIVEALKILVAKANYHANQTNH